MRRSGSAALACALLRHSRPRAEKIESFFTRKRNLLNRSMAHGMIT